MCGSGLFNKFNALRQISFLSPHSQLREWYPSKRWVVIIFYAPLCQLCWFEHIAGGHVCVLPQFVDAHVKAESTGGSAFTLARVHIVKASTHTHSEYCPVITPYHSKKQLALPSRALHLPLLLGAAPSETLFLCKHRGLQKSRVLRSEAE